jgi:hypothetical protein
MRLRSIAITAICLTLVLIAPNFSRLGAHAAPPSARPMTTTWRPGSLGVYQLDPRGSGLRALDPRSLANLPHTSLLHTEPRHDVSMNDAPAFAVSSDGSRVVALYSKGRRSRWTAARKMTLQIFDTATGTALSRPQHPAIPFWMLAVSPNGSRVVGVRSDFLDQPCVGITFYVLDTRSGRILQRIKTQVSGGGAEPFLVDASLHFLYLMDLPDRYACCGSVNSQAPTVAAFNLVSGQLLADVRLVHMRAGLWPTTRKVRQQAVLAYQNPGFALSPDGSQLAILDGSSNTLILLRTPSLSIEATESLSRPPNALGTLAALLGLAPDTAEAKGEIQGMDLSMHYTARGRSLLVTGSRTHIDPKKRFPIDSPIDLRLVDTASGHIQASVPTGKQIYSVWPAPDGSAVYTLVPGSRTQQLCPCTIQRRDPTTLKILASRTFRTDAGVNLYFLRAAYRQRL